MHWRQGDVLIAEAGTIPAGARRRPAAVLVWGEATGHSHRVADPETAELYEVAGTLYLRVTARAATVIHEEHGPITLRRGDYRVWTQREYTPRAVLRVVD
jgi:hypothetical protein